ncbi:nuclear transport factor 2 family protein [Streptomyces sp. C11-1]|uniref:Nuclear transport factor 2 family protein n=1 Tax=Streptomyces durocortorensis TaxID=2811104 RepID=A0ABY9VX96_9ACTN|nr:nuclear transport factor 2 family protein [Streptomyces durocortorensis]WNF28398.1 nuclear transport factor 2 family protein [Streptomyces durocortorensis]
MTTTNTAANATATQVLGDLLQEWQSRFNEPDPERAAALFTEDALFQGLFPEPVTGPESIAGYYRQVPPGTRAIARVLHAYRGGDDWIGGLAQVVFHQHDGDIPVRLSLVAVRGDEGWRIRQYHVSRL